ncbi:hypothetical protein Pla175_29130 [Pirellulimonas nuda]|uniref:Uncharacterized protein n=1 Tax=Pirellulimonas nuda TaxID=2528009 RepID=A0A518DDG9_9BACT|nr:substrate-binding domain-containing protein [Pirellulimonas nuda]QDU89521.1 hypothetical protein Pla175_29130 [Pirellulimonas nuda]
MDLVREKGIGDAIIPLTTVRQPLSEIADLAMSAMQYRLAHPQSTPGAFLAKPKLMIRRSSEGLVHADVLDNRDAPNA